MAEYKKIKQEKKDFIDWQNEKYGLNLPYTATLTELRKTVEKMQGIKENE